MPAFSRFTQLAESLPATVPFVGPETQERARGAEFAARLGANESGFGPAPSVIAAIAAAAELSWRYCDPENHDLRMALSAHLGLPPEAIVVGEGIDGLLGLVVRLIVERDTPVVTSLGAYPTFNFHVVGHGGRLVTAPYLDDREDLNALIDLVERETAPLVYVSNPDNPTGSCTHADSIVALARALPATTMLVLDEAYCEMAPPDSVPAIGDLAGMPNVIRFRTFSKVYGLAGLRVGYAFGDPDTMSRFHRVRNHFGVTRIGQVAALAALADQDWLTSVIGRVARARDRLSDTARANGLVPLVSAANFVAMDCGDDQRARAILSGLVGHGVFIRMPGVAPLNRLIRVSTGPDAELDVFSDRLSEVVATIDS